MKTSNFLALFKIGSSSSTCIGRAAKIFSFEKLLSPKLLERCTGIIGGSGERIG